MVTSQLRVSRVGGVLLALASIVMLYLMVLRPLARARGAAAWTPATCHVDAATITDESDSDGSSYRMELRYTYAVGDRQYTGSRLSFAYGDTSDGHEDTLRNRFPRANTDVACWVDPTDPSRSVISIDLGPGIGSLVPCVLLPLAIGMILHRPDRSRRRVRDDGKLEITQRNASAGLVAVGVGFALFAPFGLAALWMVPAAAHGIGWSCVAIGAFGALALVPILGARCTRIAIVVDGADVSGLRVGSPTTATCAVTSPFGPFVGNVELIGREQVTWREGSSPRIELHTFHARDLARRTQAPVPGPPSSELGDNRIDWHLHVVAGVPWVHDVSIDLPIAVRGAPAINEAPVDEIVIPPAHVRLAFRLDDDCDSFAPGEWVSGTVAWSRDEAPRRATVSLVWTSHSAQANHREVVEQVDLARVPRLTEIPGGAPYRVRSMLEDGRPLAATDRRRVRVRMPEGPYSYEGKLVEFEWQLELSVDGELEIVSIELGQ